jgi:hypothetical protein
MDIKQQADELASRCVSLVIFHQHVIKTRPSGHPIKAEILAIGVEARKCGISGETVAAKVLIELQARYEPETARRLHREITDGLKNEIQPTPVLALG